MPSKFDRLRAGEVVEIEPGRKGRLNLENKSFETSDGRTMFVGDDPDFFPSNENALSYSREKEGLQREIKKSPAGEFLFQFGNQGVAGAAKDWVNKFTKKGDDYLRTKQVHQDVSQEISEKSPWTSAGATAASFVPDIALTKGMSALKAAPTLAALHAGPRIIEEPAQVAGEAALSAAGGFLIDKGASALNRIAQRRGQIRALPGQKLAVSERNQLGQQAVKNLNEVQAQEFNILKKNVANSNKAKLDQHQNELNTRQNKMIESQNAYEQANSARNAEIVNLKNQAEIAKAQRSANTSKLESEYRAAKMSAEQETKRLNEEFKLAKEQYEQSLKQLPELQKKAQAEFSSNVVKNAQEIERSFPKNSKISSEELGIDQFIENSIQKTGLAGSTEANKSSKILKSLFPEGELLGGRELSKRYKALEDAIQRSAPEVQQTLNAFKSHLGDILPNVLEDVILHAKVIPLLKRSVGSEINSTLSSMGLGKEASRLSKIASANADTFLKSGVLSNNFVSHAESGDLARNLAKKMLSVEDFLLNANPKDIQSLKKQGLFQYAFGDVEQKHAFFINEITKKIESKLAKYEIKAMQAARNASQKLGKDVRQTYGLAEPVGQPSSPIAPSPVPSPSLPPELPPVQSTALPAPVSPPITPPLPAKPSLMAEPTQPIPQSFIPQPEPILPPSQGMAERSGDLLEKNLLGGKSLVNNPLTKLAGLKYALGPAALPMEAAYLGMKGLTSPTAAGEAARMTFKQGGIQAIDMWAQRYSSYNNGILEDPKERRSLTKEIENDQEIPIEQKAVLQSKVNRGKPLQARL